MNDLMGADEGSGVLDRLLRATNAAALDAHVARLCLRLPESKHRRIQPELHRHRSGAQKLEQILAQLPDIQTELQRALGRTRIWSRGHRDTRHDARRMSCAA